MVGDYCWRGIGGSAGAVLGLWRIGKKEGLWEGEELVMGAVGNKDAGMSGGATGAVGAVGCCGATGARCGTRQHASDGGGGAYARLVFEIPVKRILNSNQRSHYLAKGSRAARLRREAALRGIALHHDPALAGDRYDALAARRANKSTGSEGASAPVADCPPVFTGPVRVVVHVCPPTAQRCDPPNLYPTVKALIDGLTDASWWVDDDYKAIPVMEFRYGGKSGVRSAYRVVLTIAPVGGAGLAGLAMSPKDAIMAGADDIPPSAHVADDGAEQLREDG